MRKKLPIACAMLFVRRRSDDDQTMIHARYLDENKVISGVLVGIFYITYICMLQVCERLLDALPIIIFERSANSVGGG